MQRFLELIVRFKEYITLFALVVMCFSLMSYGNVAQLGGFRSIVIATIGTMQDAFSWIPNPVALKTENQAIRDLNLQLSGEVVKMRQSVIENERLRSMLEYKNKSTLPLLNSEVVGKTSTDTRNYITIDKGSASGVKDGMTVVTDAGLVGVVIGTSKSYALVQVVLNRDSRISAKIQRTHDDGIITWEGTENLVMKNIPKVQDVQAGDIITTSEYSTKYAKDIVIGSVLEVTSEGNSLFRKIIVKPAVSFSSLEQVFVVLQQPDPERLELEKKMEEILRRKTTGK
ncbi:MAG: rod shape-determining protein MreC [Candidatus Kapabacteria bacterium]|nr:rod shape-determining protein MreC [Candidatus Kapabacteria bacterium]MBX7156129.1 rod shape-determining protein MreC [Bacteroidota bacterium]